MFVLQVRKTVQLWIRFRINFTVWDVNNCIGRGKWCEISKIADTFFYQAQLHSWSLSSPNTKSILLKMRFLWLCYTLSESSFEKYWRSATGTPGAALWLSKNVLPNKTFISKHKPVGTKQLITLWPVSDFLLSVRTTKTFLECKTLK